MLRVAFIGAGRISELHAPGYLAEPRARLDLVCDRDPVVAARRAAAWGAPRSCTDPAEVLADPGIDLVELLVPHHLHAPLTIAAAAAGKHVSVQKPMALDVAECDAMIDACRRAGVVLRVFENFVFHPPYVRARELLDAGEIGEPLSIRLKLGAAGRGGWHVPLAAWLWRLDAAASGGGPTILDDGYHKLSLAMDLLGPVESVDAMIGNALGALDCPAVLTWRHANGASGVLDATFSPNLEVASRYYPADERVEITGTRGWIRLAQCTGSLEERPALELHRDGRVTAFCDLETDWQASFTACTRHLVGVLTDGGEPRLCGERGRRRPGR